MNGKNITGGLTISSGFTLNAFDSTTDDYKSTTYGRISGGISGAGTVAAATSTTTAQTTIVKSYIKVTEGNEVSFH